MKRARAATKRKPSRPPAGGSGSDSGDGGDDGGSLGFTLAEIPDMTRRRLMDLCKRHHITANSKSVTLKQELRALYAVRRPSLPAPAA